jgi:GrpB-like predicted nucleotidyltransferase (UPF0157 family)
MLLPAEQIRDQALEILRTQRDWLRLHGIAGNLKLIGGSSVPGALTKGDVDLHLTVPAEAFASTVAELERSLRVVHPEIWCPTLATFSVSAALPTGLAVTPLGSEHDVRFTRTWHLLATDPVLLAEYCALKIAHDGEPEYEQEKSAFFDRLVELWPPDTAGG